MCLLWKKRDEVTVNERRRMTSKVDIEKEVNNIIGKFQTDVLQSNDYGNVNFFITKYRGKNSRPNGHGIG